MKLRKGFGMLIASVLGLIMLILDSKTAIEGAQSGLELCFHTVIPSLFPFIFLSSLLTGSLMLTSFKSIRPVCSLFKIPNGTDAILLTGLLGGYPIGAKCVNDAVINGRLSKVDGERMVVFCNAAGPAFLFGITANLFEQRWIPWCLWCIHLLSALCMSSLLPAQAHSAPSKNQPLPFRVTQKLRQSIQAMAEICGWIILMRVVITVLQRWCLWYLPQTLQIFIIGVTELSNGCISLCEIENTGLRFVLCSVFLGFGGLCVALQTNSATTAISCRKYLTGKIVQGFISFILAYTAQYFFLRANQRLSLSWAHLVIIIGIAGILCSFTGKNKKSSGILETIGV